MKKPIFNIKKHKDRYTVDVKMDSIYIDPNGWGHFHFKPSHIKNVIIDEFADLSEYEKF